MDRDRDDRARELEATHARAEKRRATSDATARRTRERNEREGRKNNHAVRARDDEEEEEEEALDARARSIIDLGRGGRAIFVSLMKVSVDDVDDDDARAQGDRAHSGWTVWESNRGQVLGGAKTTKTGEVDSRAGGGVESSARARVNEGGGEDARGMMDDRS